jgi:hypothetical protein
MKWLVLVGVMLVAAGPAIPAASSGLVYKAPPSARLVPNANPIHLRSPRREDDLFRRFLEWLKREVSLTSTMLHHFEDRTVRGGQAIDARRGKADRGEHREAMADRDNHP